MMADVRSDNYYKVLGVSKRADDRALKKAYRRLAMRWHPDKNAGDRAAEDNFKRISEAYEVLSDPQKRAVFDRYGKQGLQAGGGSSDGGAGGGGSEAGGFSGGFTFTAPPPRASGFSDPHDIFAQLFGGMMGGGGMGMGGGADGGADTFDLGSLFGGVPGGGRPSKRPRHPPAAAFNRLQAGDSVIIRGLSSRPALNGQTATISRFDPAKGRYITMLAQSGETLALKPECVVHAVDGVRVTGLASRPAANGEPGAVVGWDERTQRFHIKLSRTGELLALQPDNVLWPNRTVVRVQGLQQATVHNNKWGRVEGFDGSRYTVRVGDARHVRLKPSNIAVACSA